ncbi:hypothetical protein [Planktomarina sp.]|uniref:hypothetical protein n=1 Tax=Planktomarina sp. TaxID=2024851 RepID=UPI0032602E9C
MAFARTGLCRIGGSGTGGSTWQYTSTDAKTDVDNADYFLAAISELALGDLIICKDTSTPATPVVTITYIKARTATSITAAAGTTITA